MSSSKKDIYHDRGIGTRSLDGLLCGLIPDQHMSGYRIAFIVLLLIATRTFGQVADSLRTIELQEVEVKAMLKKDDIQRLPEIQGTIINAGKKNEVIVLTALDADLSTNNARQVLAKVPGLTIWESDGSGIQLGVATRGLSPNRSWEFNVRQNGYDICAEAFGYPEAYYSPPM